MTAGPLRYTLITATVPDRLTKRFEIDPDGAVEKLKGGNLWAGRAQHGEAHGLHDLARQLDDLATNQAVCWGMSSSAAARVFAERNPDALTLGAITRTREHFAWPDGPGVLLLDHDEFFPDTGVRLETAEAVRAVLVGACPALAAAPMLIRPSASAGVQHADGRTITPLGKWHIYIPATRAAAIPDAGQRLGTLLQAAGYAWAFIDKAGCMEDRTAVDLGVWLPERLDFAAGPELGPGVARPRVPGAVFGDPLALFDLATIPAPTTANMQAAALACVNARRAAEPIATAKRLAYFAERSARIAAKTGEAVEAITARYAASLNGGALPVGHELVLESGERVTVGEVVKNWAAHIGKKLHDPIDPERSNADPRIGMFVWADWRPGITSYAGGKKRYGLEGWPEVVFAGCAVTEAFPVAPAAVLAATPPTPAPAVEITPLTEIPTTPSEDALALAFVTHLTPRYRYTPGMGWMFNLGTRWEPDNRMRHFDDARLLCREVGRDAQEGERKRIGSAKTVAAVVKMAAADQRIVLDPEEWDADPMALNTPGALYDLRTGQPINRAGHYLTQCAAVAPDFAASAPTFHRFLNEVFTGDAEVVEFIQRALGYCITGEIREQVLFFWHGTGSNGKSTLLDLVQWLTDTYALKLPADTLMTSRNERHPTGIAQLLGKRLAVSSELDEGQFFNEPLVKELTGDQRMRARFMNKDFFTFHQTQKHVIVGNFRPRLRGGDPAIARRMVLVPFDAVFEEHRKDPTLLGKLKAEGPAVLAWLIRGAIKWHCDGLQIPSRVRAASAEYMQAHDDLQQWIDECCEKAGETKASDLYANFKAWKERRGEHAPSLTSWGDRLSRLPGMEKRASNGMRYSPIRLLPVQWPGAR